MLKRKRSDGRPPAKTNGNNKNNYSAKPPPSTTPRPEKAVGAFEASYTDVLRALKKARGFERQRLGRRITEEKKEGKAKNKKAGKKGKKNKAAAAAADDERTDEAEARIARLEREVEVLKTLDYEVTARVHLANAMLRVKSIADAPGPLGAHLQLASEVLSQRTKAYRTDDIHNVTSALYNRPFVRDAVAKAVRGMCELLGLPPPDKNATKGKPNKKEKEATNEDEDDEMEDVDDETRKNTQSNTPKTISRKAGGDDESSDEEDNLEYNEADDAEIERELAKYDNMVGSDDEEMSGNGDEEADDDLGDSDDDSDEDLDDDAVVAKLRAKYAAAVAKGLWKDDDERSEYSGEETEGEDIEEGEESEGEEEEEGFGGFSSGPEEEDDEDDGSDSESDEDLRPRKRNATASASASAPTPGTSHFLPSLMGGYISDDGGDEDGVADDEEAAARMLGGPRKNRRGQRARQAIWEKKYKQLAKHVLEEEKKAKDGGGKDGKSGKNGKGKKDGGWDAKRGAVDASDKPRWMRRKMGLLGRVGPAGGGASNSKPAAGLPKKDNPNANSQVSGSLHPSWEAARKAKELAKTASFAGTKITFD